jgi:putative GTP pyrophosphokinase
MSIDSGRRYFTFLLKRVIIIHKKGTDKLVDNVLEVNGLSLDILEALSYRSRLGVSLKKNLHYFDKDALLTELIDMSEWLSEQPILDKIALDFRVKSEESIRSKYDRYYPDHQVRKVFNDIMGFRAFCDDYNDVLGLGSVDKLRIADMSHGKAHDDGYRGIHVYYQLDSECYPIEIQFNTLYDRQLNNWLHDYLYKKNYSLSVGQEMRSAYENGKIHSAEDFEEVLKNVLSRS